MTTHSQKAAFEEGAALSLLRELGDPPTPIDAFELAKRCGLRVLHGAPTRLAGVCIYVSRKLPLLEQHELVFHELGHYTLRRYDVPDSEWGATYVGDALALPRAAILRDLAEVGTDVPVLMQRHVWCSERVVRRRLAALEWQGGRAA